MKKLFFSAAVIIALTVGFLSCNNEDSPIESPTNIERPSNKRSFNEALLIAQNATNMLGDKQSRSSHRTINRDDAFAICSGSAQSRNSDTLLYIFNYDDNAGYAIVSASLNTEGLLAVAESGRLDSKEHSEVPGVNMFIDLAKSYVANSDTGKVTIGDKIGGGISTPTMQKEVTDTPYSHIIEPRIKLNWGQDGVEGLLFPNRIAGCATIAALNAFTYLEQPTSIQLTKLDKSIMSVNWQSIKGLSLKSTNGEPYHTTETASTISKLCREFALRCGIKGPELTSNKSTEINPMDMYNILKEILPTASISNIYSYYDAEHSLPGIEIVFGYYKDSSDATVGHGWVVDGSQFYKIRHRRYIKPDTSPHWTLTDEFNRTEEYMHVNWGWHGANNGFYSKGVFDTSRAKSIDYRFAGNNVRYYNIDIKFFNVSKSN